MHVRYRMHPLLTFLWGLHGLEMYIYSFSFRKTCLSMRSRFLELAESPSSSPSLYKRTEPCQDKCMSTESLCVHDCTPSAWRSLSRYCLPFRRIRFRDCWRVTLEEGGAVPFTTVASPSNAIHNCNWGSLAAEGGTDAAAAWKAEVCCLSQLPPHSCFP